MKSKARVEMSNPAVIENLNKLVADWPKLSNVERATLIHELNELGCPTTEIAKRRGCAEGTLRYFLKHYYHPTQPRNDAVAKLPRNIFDITEAYLDADDDAPDRFPDEPESVPPVPATVAALTIPTPSAVSLTPAHHTALTSSAGGAPVVAPAPIDRFNDTKKACQDFLNHRYNPPSAARIVEFVQERCGYMLYCGYKPPVVAPNTVPSRVLELCCPRDPSLEDYEAATQQLAKALLILLEVRSVRSC
jgi:hypothetical protein